jgi:hypothetical protein
LAKKGEIEGTVTLFKLYGVAITALLVGYASAFWIIARGDFPWAVVEMGCDPSGFRFATPLVSRYSSSHELSQT